MKAKLLLLLFITLTCSATGQVTEGELKLRKQTADSIQGWKHGAVLGLNFGQTSLTNWAAGGQNSFAVNGLFSAFSNYKKDKTVWDNSLDIGYGLLKQGKNADFMKTDDRFDLLSKYGRQAGKDFYYAALVNFKSQMTLGKSYGVDTLKISNLLAPAYVLAAIGMDYKPNSYFSAFLAPFTGKLTIVNDEDLANAGAFGVTPATLDGTGNVITPGERLKGEFGGYLRAIYSKSDFKSESLKNMSLSTKIDLFSNYLYKPQNIDVSWETMIVFKVNKYISVNLNTHLIYDADILFDTNGDGANNAPLVQFKEILGVGFLYKFN